MGFTEGFFLVLGVFVGVAGIALVRWLVLRRIRRQLAAGLIEELNAILQKGIPALFSELAAQNIWIAPARPIAPPVRKR